MWGKSFPPSIHSFIHPMDFFETEHCLQGEPGSRAYSLSTLQLRQKLLPAELCRTHAEAYLRSIGPAGGSLFPERGAQQLWEALFQGLQNLQGFEFYMLMKLLRRPPRLDPRKATAALLRQRLAVLGPKPKLGIIRNDLEQFKLSLKYHGLRLPEDPLLKQEVLSWMLQLSNAHNYSCAGIMKITASLRRSSQQALLTAEAFQKLLRESLKEEPRWLSSIGLRPDLDLASPELLSLEMLR